jgi:hypothetical protein
VIERNLPQSVIREIEKETSEEALIVFLTIYQANLFEPIRVVSDPENFVLDGKEYTGFEFNVNLLSDDDSPPQAKLTIANVDERIGQAILASTSPVNLSIEIIPLSEFNLNTYPRQEKDTPSLRVYRATHLRLTDVTGDLMAIQGTIRSWDYSQEPWPSIKATQSRFPALFWS